MMRADATGTVVDPQACAFPVEAVCDDGRSRPVDRDRVAERPERAREIAGATAHYDALSAVIDALIERGTFESLVAEVARAARRLVDLDRLVVLCETRDGRSLHVAATESFGASSMITPGARRPRLGAAPSHVLESGMPMIAADLDQLAEFPESQRVLVDEGLRSCCLLPLPENARIRGVVAMLSRRRCAFDSGDLPTFRRLTGALSLALDGDPRSSVPLLDHAFRDERLRRVQEFVEDHYDDRISLSRAAGVAGVERTYFSKLFHRSTGKCFRDWLAEERVARSKECMVATDHSITRIAFDVGFQSLSAFERTFQRVEKVTPSAYRRSVREPTREVIK